MEVEFDDLFAPDCVVSRDGKLEAMGRSRNKEVLLSLKQKRAAHRQEELPVGLNGSDDAEASQMQKSHDHQREAQRTESESLGVKVCTPSETAKSALVSQSRQPCLRSMERCSRAGNWNGSDGPRAAISVPLPSPQLGKGMQSGGLIDLHGTGSSRKPSIAKVSAVLCCCLFSLQIH